MKNESYYGGKSGDGHYQQIINLIPPHSAFIEPFGGKVGIFRHKKPSHKTFIIERDARLEEYYKKIGVERCHHLDAFKNRLIKTGPGAYYIIGDALEILDDAYLLFDRIDHYLYVDPPYLLKSRKDNRPTYKYELTDEDHRDLLETLKGFSQSKIGISTYPNELYTDALAERDGWDFVEISAQTRHGRVIENFWMNYAIPNELHDYRYLGTNYREREDITRKQKRWRDKFIKMPMLERRAMIETLLATIG